MTQPSTIEAFFKKLGVRLTKDLAHQAFVHRSYLNEHPTFPYPSNERLEFLGDSVLSIAISEHLYKSYPDKNEGYLTAVRSAAVSKTTLAAIARSLSLGDFLYLAKGEEESNGRKNPSILANTLEALIGAIYLDKGLATAKKVVLELLTEKVNQVVAEGRYQDNKSMLQEHAQNQHLGSPIYKVLSSRGPDHAREFTIGAYVNGTLVGKGSGNSKQVAAQEAAKAGLSTLTGS